jgi:oligogalacturonide transport system permease protein
MLVKRAQAKKKHKKYQKIGYLYILPWIIGLLVFQLMPLIGSFIYSFTDYSIVGDTNFVGLKNYITAFTTDANFMKSLSVTLIYVFTAVPTKLIMALVMALILNSKLKGIRLFRTAYYLPSIMGASVAVSILWRFMFMKTGFINNALSSIGLDPVDWMGTPAGALITISLITVWQFGSSMVLYLAALKQVPNELYESARIDGAGPVRRLFKITLPMISPVIFFTLVMQLILGFQDFTAPMLVSSGGPNKATYLYGLMLYDNAFRFFKMGYASALSWILFIIIIIVTVIIFKFSNVMVYYQDGGDE